MNNYHLMRLVRKLCTGVFLLTGCLIFPQIAGAANFTWNAGDGLFQTGANWDPASVPGTSDDIYLLSATPVEVTSNANSTVRFLTVGTQSGGSNDSGNFTLNLGSTTLTASGASIPYGIDYTGFTAGGTKSLTVSSGTLETSAIRMQQSSAGTSQLYVSGSGAIFNTAGAGATTTYSQIGHSGPGLAQVFIQSGGIWNVTNATTELGSNGDATGFMRVTGTGSAFNSSSANVGNARLGFFVGTSATGTLEVLNGGLFSIDDLNVARNASSTGTVLVSNANSTLNGKRIMVGGGVNTGGQSPSAGGDGTFTISDGAEVNAESFYVLNNTTTSGMLILDNGTLNITSDQVYNDSTITGNGTISGTVRMNTAGAVVSSSDGALNLDGLVVAANGTLGAGTVSVSGNTIINSSRTLTVNGTLDGVGALTLDGSLAGTGTVNKAVTSVANTISSTGTLTLGSSYTIQGNFGPSTISAGTIAVTGTTTVQSTRVLNNNGTLAGTGDLVVNGSIDGSGTVNKTGGTINGGGSINQAVTLSGNTTLGAVALSSTLTVNDTGNSVAAATSPTVAGLTTIASGGALAVNGTLGGAGAMTVNGILSGTGTVSKAVTVGASGTLSPGNSPGNQTLSSLTLTAGGNYNWQVYDATGSAGTGFDTITLTGELDLTGLSTSTKFNINLWSLSGIGPDVDGNAINFDNAVSQSWVLVGANSVNVTGLSSPLADYFAVNTNSVNGTSGFSNILGGGSFSVSVTGNDLALEFTAVPEPSVFALAGVGLLMVVLLGRKRRSYSIPKRIHLKVFPEIH